jgi:hypothetical protein
MTVALDQDQPSRVRRLLLGFELAVKSVLLVCALLLLVLVILPCVAVIVHSGVQ